MSDRNAPDLSLDGYLQVSMNRYDSCIDVLKDPTQLDGSTATARFHHLKLDSNGRPRWKDLAQNLAYHILSYCFASRRRAQAENDADLMELRHEAREFFRDESRSGEAGELLLYMLLEAVLKAPQMVSKISLKTNANNEILGSDGIHMKWHKADQLMDVYFGEAKLYQHVGAAVKSAAASIESFHQNSMEEFELRMVTRHFKHADCDLRDQVLNFVNRGTATSTVRVNHACLIGYNWKAYQKLVQQELPQMQQDLKSRYRVESDKISKILESRFSSFTERRLRFEIFVMPFESVEAFRKAFLDAI